ncbi:hypothetical protein [Desertibacillus haloalkaliphilus]|uniref:hypothetical protein n=1 Tax=Desertibacillus haloalkaliphilus TaxID=1328930 RepID=UPI001C254D4E|nr:hypothetical protein [Desertibacillus haloalkaliphilus]MBU8909005.1 hypothetical protein [Desertibacillus haloalkaliphilus]
MKKAMIITFTVVLLFILIAGGFLYYQVAIKEYETDDEQLNEIFATQFEIEVSGTTVPDTKEKEKGQATKRTDETETTNEENEVNEKQQLSTEGEASTVPGTTAEKIQTKYEPAFNQLEDYATNQLDQLINRAVDEYQEKQASDEGISYTYFYSKYKSAADQLEAQIDSHFDEIYTTLKDDLEQHGHQTDKASIYKEHYEAEKRARMNGLLQRVAEWL